MLGAQGNTWETHGNADLSFGENLKVLEEQTYLLPYLILQFSDNKLFPPPLPTCQGDWGTGWGGGWGMWSQVVGDSTWIAEGVQWNWVEFFTCVCGFALDLSIRNKQMVEGFDFC